MTVVHEGEVLMHTNNAVLVTFSGMSFDRVWLPKSLIRMRPAREPRISEIEMPEWLAIEKGIE